MKFILALLLLLPAILFAHPGIGIVKDSKGNIYYTDLENVWKVAPDGSKTIAVRGVHSHELYMDGADALFGQHSSYSGEATNRWYHYLWRLRANGILDTIKPTTEGFFIENYSFARDSAGNMYWVQQGKEDRIVKTSPQGASTVLANGSFKRVQWLLPVGERLYYVYEDGIYYIDSLKNVKALVENLSAKSAAHNTLFGLWADAATNIYVANTSAHKIQTVSPGGVVKDYYTSEGNWSPTGGLFDNDGNLWVLEYNTNNEARVQKVTKPAAPVQSRSASSGVLLPLSIAAIAIAAIVVVIRQVVRQ